MKKQKVVFIIPQNQCPLLRYSEFSNQKDIILGKTTNEKFSFEDIGNGYKITGAKEIIIEGNDLNKIMEIFYEKISNESRNIFETIFPLYNDNSWNVRFHELEFSRFGIRRRYEFFHSTNQSQKDSFKQWRGGRYDLIHISFEDID